MIDCRTEAGNKQDKPAISRHAWKQRGNRRLLGSYQNEIVNFEEVFIGQRWDGLNIKNNNDYNRLKCIKYIKKSVYNDLFKKSNWIFWGC